jgi:signal transduction histidine kinase
MPARTLDRHFSRRMLPLAAVATLVVAAVPPLSYWLATRQKLTDRAAVYAEQLAANLRIVAERQPRLWRYNAAKVYQATTAHRRLRDIGGMRVIDCAGQALFSPEGLGVGTGVSGGPTGRAAVIVHGRAVAFVEVTIDPSAERRALFGIAAVAAAIGLAVGLLLFLFPTTVVRRQARQLAETLDRLRAAESDLTTTNRGLEQRVATEVRAVRELSGRVVQIQEEERERIARDLHDGLGQGLTALQLEVEQARALPGQAPRHLAEAIRMCRDTLAELRRVVHDLRPPELAAQDAIEALRGQAERFEERTGVATSFRAVGGPLHAEDAGGCLFRVLQEALTNVSRHAGAREVGVTVVVGELEVTMEVVDDGAGFDAATKGDGAGLRGIRERCALLGGRTDVQASPGGGTRLAVSLPLRGGRR